MHISWSYIAPLIIVLCFSFLYKVYLENKIRTPDKVISIFSILAFHRFGIMSLFPLSKNSVNETEKKLRIKANRALFVFYFCFISILILVKLQAGKNS